MLSTVSLHRARRCRIRPILACLLLWALAPTSLHSQHITRVWPAEAQSSLRGIVVTDNGRLYTAGDNSTLLESSDNGRSWKELSLDDHVLHIYKLCTDGTMLFLLAYPPRNTARPDPWPEGYASQVFRVDPRDGSVRHVPHPLLSVPDSVRMPFVTVYDIAVTRNVVYLMYSGHRRSRLLYSMDKGTTWVDLPVPFVLDASPLYLHTREGADDILLYRNVGAGQSLLLTSPDFGASWTSFNGPTTDRDAVRWLHDGRILLHSVVDGSIQYLNTDGRWSNRGIPPFGLVSSFVEGDNGRWWAFTNKGGRFMTEDEGSTWVMLQPELLAGNNVTITRCLTVGADTLLLVDDFGSIESSTDGGASWNTIRSLEQFLVSATMADSTFGIARVRHYKGAPVTNSALYRVTEDGFGTLRPIPAFPLSHVYPRTRSLWFAVGSNGWTHDSLLCRSTDAGEHWELTLRLPDAELYTTTVESRDPAIWAVATSRGLYTTTDSGATWTQTLDVTWTRESCPRKIVIPGAGKAIWMSSGEGSPWSLIRSNATWASWDTVFTYSESERSALPEWYGLLDFQVLLDGAVLTFAITLDDAALLHYSEDEGHSWQSWMTKPLEFNEDDMSRPLLLPGGVLLTLDLAQLSWSRPWIKANTVSMSRDLLRSSIMLFEHATASDIMESSRFVGAGASTVYLLSDRAAFRIRLSDVTGIASPQRPPLPLHIDTPYPHPIPIDGGAVALSLRSDKAARVTLDVVDLAGHRVDSVLSGEILPGQRTLYWNPAGLAAGRYVLRASSSEGVACRTVLLY